MKPRISAYFVCFNEEKIMPHLLRHYASFCEKITILDNYSTDRSCEIVECFGGVEIIKFDSQNSFNDRVNARIKNTVWKRDVGNFDFVITSDADEFICHEDILGFLQQRRDEGFTIFQPFGYNMAADEDFDLRDDLNLLDEVPCGVRVTSLDKFNLFDCNKIVEMNLSVGSHVCRPVGQVKIYHEEDLKLKHFKYIGLENYMKRCKSSRERLSDFNKQHNLATFYLENDEYHIRGYTSHIERRVLV